jgi:putative transposase
MRVSRAGYYAWLKRPESQRSKDDRKLAILVKAAHEAGRCYYGSPRVLCELKDQGIRISRKRVIRLMQAQSLAARKKKRKWRAGIAEESRPAAPNILAREFSAPLPNKRWVGDATELVIGGSSKLFLAVILDLFSRFVVGWAVSASNDRHLAIKALESAIKRRCPEKGLLYHSDQGGPYTSEDYQKALEASGIVCSMSRRGNCYDNAAMESWFSSLKSELGENFESFAEAKAQVFDYIEVFYNQKRRHSSLDNVSPAEYERRARVAVSPAA